MARLVLGVAGAAIGSVLVPGAGASWGWAIGSMLGGALFPEQLPDVHQQGQRLNDLEVQSSAYGQMIPWIRGTYPPPSNVIWAKPLTDVATTTSQESGGKGSPSQTTSTTTFQYFATFAIALCEGEAAGVTEVRINGELVYVGAITATSGEVVISNEKWQGKLRFYPGSETQTVDPAIEEYEGVGESSAYRGTAHLVIEDLDVTAIRTLPLVQAVVAFNGTSGQSVTYFDEFLTSPSTSFNEATAYYIQDRGEVWVRDAEHFVASPLEPARIAIKNLITGDVEYVSLPEEFPYAGFDDVRNMQHFPEWDLMLVAGRLLDYPYAWTGLYFSVSTRQYLGSYTEHLTGVSFGHEVSAIDTANSRALVRNLDASPGLQIWELSDSHFPLTLAASFNYTQIDSRVDNDGNFWIINSTTKWVKLTPAGVATEYTVADGIGQDKFCCDYDASRHVIYYWSRILGGTEYLEKLDCATGVATRLATYTTSSGEYPWSGFLQYDATTDRIHVLNSGTSPPMSFFIIDPSDGSTEAEYNITDHGGAHFGGPFAYAPGVVWSFSSLLTMTGSSLGELRFSALTPSSPTLASVHTDLSAEVGVSAAQLDVTALTGITVRGYGVMRTGTARAALEALMHRYDYACVESDGKIKAVLLGGSSVATLTEDDLGVASGESRNTPRLTVSRKQEIELPLEVRVSAPDIDAAYAIGMQYERRLGGASEDIQEFASTVVMTADEMRQMAARKLYGAHANRLQLQWTTNYAYAWIEPTDVVTITRGALTHNVRIVDKREPVGVLTWSGVTEDANIYTQTMDGSSLPVATTGVTGLSGLALALIDGPVLREQDVDSVGIYASAVGYAAGWRSGELYKSINATDYTSTGARFIQGGSIGVCNDVLGDFSGGNVFDHLNTLTVTLYPGSAALESSTADLVLAGQNYAAIINGEVVEIIGYITATLIGTNQYRLQGLLRGRACTEHYMGDHSTGARFVALKSSVVHRLELSGAELNSPRYYKPVTSGRTVAQTAANAFTFTNVGQKCPSPVDLRGSRDASGDLTGAWTHRVRGATQWADSIDLPITDSKLYDVEVYDSTYATLKRTFNSLTSEAFTYTGAEQTTDFGSNQNPVYVRVHPINSSGRGFYLQGSI